MTRDTLVSSPADERLTQVGDIRPGTLLRDTYRVLNHVSSGAVGSVFAAGHTRLPGLFAVKALQGDRVLDPDSLARFRAEAEVTASLRHPHIVQILDFDVSPGGVPFFVMEFLEGGDLRYAAAKGPMEPERVARLIRQIASALHTAHASGVVHRDLKPENVMLVEIASEPDYVKVVDFGLSKLMHPSGPPVTKPDQVLGTPGYMPPEQVLGRRIDARADQFALASLAYELFAGRPAFTSADPNALMREILYQEPPLLESLVPWPAAQLSTVLARGMAKAPAERYPGVAEFEQALRSALDEDARPKPSGPAGGPPAGDSEPDTPDLLALGKSFRW
jgi:serine/threonine protein kinase